MCKLGTETPICKDSGASTAVAPSPSEARPARTLPSEASPALPAAAKRCNAAGASTAVAPLPNSSRRTAVSGSGDQPVRSEAASTVLAKGNGSGALTAPRAVCKRFSARVYYKGDYIIRCGAKTTVGFKSLWAMEHYYQCYCCKDYRECRQYSEGRQ